MKKEVVTLDYLLGYKASLMERKTDEENQRNYFANIDEDQAKEITEHYERCIEKTNVQIDVLDRLITKAGGEPYA